MSSGSTGVQPSLLARSPGAGEGGRGCESEELSDECVTLVVLSETSVSPYPGDLKRRQHTHLSLSGARHPFMQAVCRT